MRSGLPAIGLVFLVSGAMGCLARTPPPMPGVAVIGGATPSPLVEEPSAPSEEREEEEEEVEYVVPCNEGTPELQAAELAYRALDKKVNALAWNGDAKPIAEELETLLEHPCLEIANADPKELLTFPNAVSLRTWWSEGGADWLWSYLRVSESRFLRASPTPRIALTLETAPKDHPLAPLLCPADESKPCATESRGWMRRANEKLELMASGHRRGNDVVDCSAEAMKKPKNERYASFRDCLETGFVKRRALPIGRFKAPSDGWLVIDDVSGSCRTLRAFDLATGSRYASEDCSRVPTTSVGRVPIGALREAAWMLLLARETQANVRVAEGFHVPEKIPVRRARGESIGLGSISCMCGSSQRRSWSWMRDKNGTLRGQVSGVIVGRADDEALEHALDLLDIADAAFEKGCAPSAAPARIAWSSPGPASDGTAAIMDDPASDAVRAALAKARPTRTCTAKP